jgi:hypothetical protein
MWAGAVAVLALTVPLVVVAAPPALAANCGNGQGGALLLGCSNNSATDATYLVSVGPYGLIVSDNGASATGLDGYGGYIGVYGTGGTYGVEGFSGSGTGVFGRTSAENQNGVYGQANNSGGSGVYGANDGAGYGVAGRADSGTGVLGDSLHGVGVLASSTLATALDVEGRASFSRSGLVSISYPNKSATVSVPGGLTSSSLVLALVQDASGVYVKSAVPNTSNGTVQINLNKAPGSGTNPKTAHVAWFVLN